MKSRILAHLTLSTLVLIGCSYEQPSVVNGADGITPTVTSRAATPQECPQGGTVLSVNGNPNIICDGSTGATGPSGVAGNPGLNGSDGTTVGLIQLCPGTTVYPSVFLEYALCIQDELYGVYSYANGFLALLPPGTYSSNAIGSQCTLTIHPHCVVTW